MVAFDAVRLLIGALALSTPPVPPPPPASPPTAPRTESAAPSMGRQFPEADRLFHADPRWLGADAALSVPLGGDRTLWLFGDTFVAVTDAHRRAESRMPRNTVAIQRGLDPLRAEIDFAWGRDANGGPASFFPDQGERFFWPGHGLRLPNGPLVVFLFGIVNTPGVGLGFDAAGRALAVVDDPDAPLERWSPRIVNGPELAFDAVPATAIVRDGDFAIGLAIRQRGTHAGSLVRYPLASLAKGSFEGESWWMGPERGWVPTADVGASGPLHVMDDAGSECSLHLDPRTKSFVHVASYGFGATTIGVRTAPAITGPWSDPVTVFRPPESDAPRPFVYAAKGHVELIGPGAADLLVTYAVNSPEFADLFSEQGVRSRYWPRFVAVPLDRWMPASTAASAPGTIAPSASPVSPTPSAPSAP